MHARRAWLRGLGVLMLVSVVWTKPELTGQEWAHSNGFSGSPRSLGCGEQLAP